MTTADTSVLVAGARGDLEVDRLQVGEWYTTRHVQDLDSDHLLRRVEIRNDSGVHFLGLDDVRVIQPNVQRIRCLVEGGIRIDTHGRSTSYGPGGAWFESGPDPVFAQAASDRPSRFIRVMILPRALIGKSSIEYLDEQDKARPKSQQYKVFVDSPIDWPRGA